MMYMLKEREIIKTDNQDEWCDWFSSTNRTIRLSKISEDLTVSTIFLGIDHRFTEEGEPLLFETMVFGGKYNEQFVRYPTIKEAILGHNKIVTALIKKNKDSIK